jgi:hypothetical protein
MFDIKVDPINRKGYEDFDVWALENNKKYKRVFSNICFDLITKSKFRLHLYSPHYISEEQVINDTIHEIVETSVFIALGDILNVLDWYNEKTADVIHLVAGVSLYDGSEEIIIDDTEEFSKVAEKFLKKIGYKYKYIKDVKHE